MQDSMSFNEPSRQGTFCRRYLYSALGGTVFCLLFFLIYDRFSHGVRSPYMTYLFVWPLLLEFLPALVLTLFHIRPGSTALSAPSGKTFDQPAAKVFAALFWHSGTAALTAGSALRGIFDIAGNASRFQKYLMIAGLIMLCISVILFIISIIFQFSLDKSRKN